jgi:hypothetical protein
MKKKFRLIVPAMIMVILSVFAEKLIAQNDPPWLPDQHGYNGNQSPNGAPLDGGTEVLLSLGIFYLAMKITVRKRNTNSAQ